MSAWFAGHAAMLPMIWAAILAVAVAMYVLLDGFDLGVGMLFPLFVAEADRDKMMNSVAPFWDGNGTWLVLGGGGLMVAFPRAYAIIMPALYLPIIVMLLALILRGVSFEFRWIAKPNHRAWDWAFGFGSTLAAFCQGLVLGGLLQGIHIVNGAFAGGTFDWFTPFAIVCGLSVIVGYMLLGACWLVMKTEHDLQARAREVATPILIAMLAAIAIVSIWTPMMIPRISERWFTLPNFYYLSLLPLATLIVAWLCWHGVKTKRSVLPFLSAIGLFLLAYIGLLISNVPYLVPPELTTVGSASGLTIADAAAAPASQQFLLIGTVFLLPIILGYTVFVYWVFRGKVGEGYH
jgi:cytochrome d ubiquinol oxidase subunit II